VCNRRTARNAVTSVFSSHYDRLRESDRFFESTLSGFPFGYAEPSDIFFEVAVRVDADLRSLIQRRPKDREKEDGRLAHRRSVSARVGNQDVNKG